MCMIQSCRSSEHAAKDICSVRFCEENENILPAVMQVCNKAFVTGWLRLSSKSLFLLLGLYTINNYVLDA